MGAPVKSQAIMSMLITAIMLSPAEEAAEAYAVLPYSPCSSPVKKTKRTVLSNVFDAMMPAIINRAALPHTLSSAPGAAPELGISSRCAVRRTISEGLVDPVLAPMTLRPELKPADQFP